MSLVCVSGAPRVVAVADAVDGDPARWPDGPTYQEWVSAEGWRGWVLFKLKSADWYLDRLDDVGQRLGFDRHVGVEMAMDGALSAINGAFDATVAAVIEAAQEFDKQAARDGGPAAPMPIPEHKFGWKGASKKLAVAASIGVDTRPLVQAIDEALEDEPPLGWLQQMRRLRNATVHHSTLARHIDVQVGEPAVVGQVTWGISVGDRGEDPVEYLRAAHRAVELLVMPMLKVCDYLAPLGIPTSGAIHKEMATRVTVAPDSELQALADRLTGRSSSS